MKRKNSVGLSESMQTILSSLICILIGLFIGFLVLLSINPQGAFRGIITIIENFMTFSKSASRLKYFGTTLVKTAPLILCSLSVCFCYKVGLFNIGAAGQYTIGIATSLYLALAFHMPWYICLLGALIVGAFVGFIIGVLKAYQNVNEVISGIMLNWIILYGTNTLLAKVKQPASPYTFGLESTKAMLPTLGLDKLFGNKYMTIAVPLSILIAVLVWIVLTKTKFGYELRATGYNKNGARYAGMKEKKNIIVTLMIGGALAALGASLLYLTDFEQWATTSSSVPSMGFDGIAATFLGGLHPIGSIFSSYFIEHITLGGSYLDKSLYPSQIADLISATIIYFSAFVLFMKIWYKRHQQMKLEKKQELQKGEEK